MVRIVMGIAPLVCFAILWHFVQNIYVLMFCYMAMALTTTDYWAKITGNDSFRVAGMIFFPLVSFVVAPFSYAYSVFLFGQLAFLLGRPSISEIANASALRRKYGIFFNAIGVAGTTVGLLLGIYNLTMK